MFDQIDRNREYSSEYKAKLKETYSFFKKHGYEFTEHALGRALNPKHGRGKKPYTLHDVLKVMKSPINYVDGESKCVRYHSNLAIIQANDTGEVITVVYSEKPKSAWREAIM